MGGGGGLGVRRHSGEQRAFVPPETTSLKAHFVPEPNTRPDLQAQHIHATTVRQTAALRKLKEGV